MLQEQRKALAGHELSDDLESFVHVLSHHLLRYRPIGLPDQYDQQKAGMHTSMLITATVNSVKVNFLSHVTLGYTVFKDHLNAPVLLLLGELRQLLGTRGCTGWDKDLHTYFGIFRCGAFEARLACRRL
ncbi:hypothetical protein OF83DRAFT_1103797 [Amylostereum chailletii]|nr:hypothetical protein OF83DRAFT_1103797 [Amylostereum chailletii]